MKYHHLGIPTDVKREGEYYLPQFKMHVLPFDTNPFGIEYIRFEEGSSIPQIVQQLPHIAFEVEDLDAAIEGQEIIIQPNSPSDGVRVAFIKFEDQLVEFLEYK